MGSRLWSLATTGKRISRQLAISRPGSETALVERHRIDLGRAEITIAGVGNRSAHGAPCARVTNSTYGEVRGVISVFRLETGVYGGIFDLCRKLD